MSSDTSCTRPSKSFRLSSSVNDHEDKEGTGGISTAVPTVVVLDLEGSAARAAKPSATTGSLLTVVATPFALLLDEIITDHIFGFVAGTGH
jgi:hypothetical protein